MLGKLIKYDLKFGMRTFFGMASVLVFGSLLLSFVDSVFFFNAKGWGLIVLALFFPVMVVSILQVYQGFKRSMYGSQGYLSLTLPVSRGNLLGSKLIAAMIWFNFMLLAAGVTMAILIAFQQPTIQEIFAQGLPSWVDVCQVIAVIWFQLNVVGVYLITAMFMGSTLSNVSVGGRRVPGVLGGVGTFGYLYLSSLCINKLIDSLLPFHTGFISKPGGGLQFTTRLTGAGHVPELPFDLVNLGALLLFAAVAYLVTLYLIKRRVDLP